MSTEEQMDDFITILEANAAAINALVANNARLLAVARAAYAYDYCMDEDVGRKERLLLKLREALAAVDDMLE